MKNKQCKNCKKYFKFQSSYGLTTPILGPVFTELNTKINSFVPCLTMCPKGPDGYVPVLETEKAILDGRLDCAFTGLSYSFAQNSIFELFTSVPFGIEADAYITYLFDKGGLERLNIEAEKDGFFFYPMALLPPETGGWFNKEITTIADFSDITMRIYGLGRNIMEEVGAKTVFLPQSAIIPALKSGEINAAEFSTIEIDESIGLPETLKYWYTPSWNQLSTVLYFVCNIKKWKSLTVKQQEMTKAFLRENMQNNYLTSNSKQIDYLLKYKSQLKVFPDNVLDSMKVAWENWLNKPENQEVKIEYEKIRAFGVQFSSYDDIMKKNV